jgi:hypothetical protein
MSTEPKHYNPKYVRLLSSWPYPGGAIVIPTKLLDRRSQPSSAWRDLAFFSGHANFENTVSRKMRGYFHHGQKVTGVTYFHHLSQ